MDENLTEYDIRQEYAYEAPPQKDCKSSIKKAIQCNGDCFKKFIFGFLPILTWLPNYSLKKHLPGDIIGGLTTAIVRIPQSLAYGLLAGVQPINGMYTAFFSPLVYTFLGTSKHVSVGTFAVISLMLGTALEKFLDAHPFQLLNNTTTPSTSTIDVTMATTVNMDTLDSTSAEAIYKMSIVASLTLLVGLIQILMGALNLGFIALFLSDPLVAAYTTGAALFVFTAQVKYFFGIDLHRQKAPFSLFKTYIELFQRIEETKPAEVIISVLTIVLLYPVKVINVKYKKQLRNIPIPMELVIVVVATIVSANIDLQALYGVEVVGTVPSGLPGPILPQVTMWGDLVADAFSISIVSFAITVSIGKLFAKRHGYKISPNQELFSLGVSQVSCAVFQGHASSGSLARSSVKESSGTKTQFSDVVSCVVIVLILLLVGPLLSPLPIACLSSIIMVNIRTLFNQFFELPRLWKLCRFDFVVWILTFTSVAFLGVDLGLAAGVIGLLATVVLRIYHPSVTVRGMLGNTEIYQSVATFAKAEEVEGVKIIRFPQSPFFGNKEILEEIGMKLVRLHLRYDSKDDRSKVKQRSRCESEQSKALLDNSGEDSDVSNLEVTNGNAKHTDNAVKFIKQNGDARNSCDDCIVVVGKTKGAEAQNGDSGIRDDITVSSVTPQSSSFGSFANIGLNNEHCFHTVIFDCSPWTFIDTMGMETLKLICKELSSSGVRVYLASLQPNIFEKLTLIEVLDEENSLVTPFPTLSIAVRAAQQTTSVTL